MATGLAQVGWLCSEHMAGWTGWWMWAGMGLFWLVVIGLVVWAAVRMSGTGRQPASSSAEDVLDARFARGEIDADEYLQRRETLRQ